MAVMALVIFLRYAAPLMIPIALGLLISSALNPVVSWLERAGVRRLAGTSLVLVGVTAALGFGLYSLRGQAADVLHDIPMAARRVRESMVNGEGANDLFGDLRRAVREVQRTTTAARTGSTPATSSRAGAAEPGGAAASGGTSLLVWGSTSLLTLAGDVLIIFFLAFFVLLGGPGFRARIIAVAGEERRTTGEILDDIAWQVQRFLLVRVVTSVIVGIATGIALALMGVEQAMFWGFTAGLFNSIPYFGPVIVSGGLAVVGLIQFGTITKAVQIAFVALVITSLEGWLITPPLMGKAARMNAITVFVGLLLWSWIWGVWGTILAVPMLAALKACCDHIAGLRPVGRLMGE
jgi:predicted PurR-regulated permease PerM